MTYIILAIIFSIAGVILGYALKEKEIKKTSPFVLQYSALTAKSRELVDGYIHARAVNDERTTFKERRK